jgi:glycine hydroxymethyltransferase
MIFYRKEFKSAIDQTVFPRFQSGPDHRNTLALAIALQETQSQAFKAYQRRVMDNTKVLVNSLQGNGYSVLSDGSDTHLMVLKVRDQQIDGAQLEKVLEAVNVSSNRNAIPGDLSGFRPGGLRIGSAPMTTKGFGSVEFKRVADIIHQALQLTVEIARRKRATSSIDLIEPEPVALFLKDITGSETTRITELSKRVLELLSNHETIPKDSRSAADRSRIEMKAYQTAW